VYQSICTETTRRLPYNLITACNGRFAMDNRHACRASLLMIPVTAHLGVRAPAR